MAINTIVLCAALFMVADAQGATYYVATNGSDSNPGTKAAPFATMQKGVTALAPGDTLYIRGGTYDDLINDYNEIVPSGTSWTSPITIAAYPGEKVTLAPSSSHNGSVAWIWIIGLFRGEHHLIFDGINLAGSPLASAYRQPSDSCVVIKDNAPHDIIVRNFECKYSNGIGTGGDSYNITFSGCDIHDNGTYGGVIGSDQASFTLPDPNPQIPGYGRAHAIYFESSNGLIENCRIHNNGEYGIHIFNGATGTGINNVTVRNNRVFNNGQNLTRWGYPAGEGILLSCGDGDLAYDNIVYNNASAGIGTYDGATNDKIFNNTSYNNGESADIFIVGYTAGAVVENNIAYPSGITNQPLSGPSTLSNNLTINPLFSDPSGGDFQLLAGSPAIGAGLNLYLQGVTTDISGAARPQTGAFDAGAYQFTSTSGGSVAAVPPKPTGFAWR